MIRKEPSFILMLPLSYIEFVPVKQNMRELLIMSNGFFACENNFKRYKNVEKGRSKCKKSFGETKQRIHKKEKKVM